MGLFDFFKKKNNDDHPEIPDCFTIDMYVTPENMRFTELKKGMHLTGMFQLQGQIAQ